MKKVIIYIIVVALSFYLGGKVEFDFNASQSISSDDIAIVNNDQRVEYLESSYKFGDEFIKLVNNSDTKFNYTVVSNADADQGMISGKYAATIVLPSNLTNSVLSINSEAPISSQITYEVNEKLSDSKAIKVEEDIVNLLGTFEDNLTYMYLYAVFDGLHNAQYGIGTVYANQEPVYAFLDQIATINIVTNHEYELDDFNEETFDTIDISTQLKFFNEVVKFYKLSIANTVTIYQEQTKDFKTDVDLAIDDFEHNNDLLAARIENVYDTLVNLVEQNTAYYDEEYSITDTRDTIEKIILEYFSQLQDLNNIKDSSRVITENGTLFDTNKDLISENTEFTTYLELISARENYYASVAEVDACINSDRVDECMDDTVGDYKVAYSDYEAIISIFDMEEDYETRLTYYLDNMEAESIEEVDEETLVNIPTEVTTYEVAKPAKKEEILPIVEVKNYNMTGNKGYVEVNISNPDMLDEIILQDLKLDNIENLVYVNTDSNQAFYDVTINMGVFNNQIEITNIDSQTISFGLSFNIVDTTKDAAITFNYGGNDYKTTVPTIADSFFIDYKYNRRTGKLDANVSYTRSDRVSEDLVFESQVLADYVDFTSAEIDNGSILLNSAFKFNESGFTIKNSRLPVNETVNFKISLDIKKTPANGTFLEHYTIGGLEYYIPVIFNQSFVDNDRVSVSDDPYHKKFDGEIENSEDDADENSLISPKEELGLKYKFTYENKKPVAVDEFSVRYELPQIDNNNIVNFTVNDVIGVVVNGELLDASFSIKDEVITVKFDDSFVTTEEINENGYYEYNFELYINLTTNDELKVNEQEDYLVKFDQLKVKYAGESESFLNTSTDSLGFAFGDVTIDNVTYILNDEICDSGAKTLQDCYFEEGETFTRTVTITNGEDVASGITLSDDLDQEFFEIGAPTYELTIHGARANSDYLATNEQALVNFSLPANSKLVITQEIKVDDLIYEDISVTNKIKLTQYSDKLADSKAIINIKPLSLKINNVVFEEQTPDGILTSNEDVNMSFDIENASIRGVSNYNGFSISNSIKGLHETYEVISIVDNDWSAYPIDESQSVSEYVFNQPILPGESVRVTVCIHVGEISTSRTSGTITLDVHKDASTEIAEDTYSYTYALSIDSYDELVKQQLANDPVAGVQTYSEALSSTKEVNEYNSNIKLALGNLEGYVGIFEHYTDILERLTVLDNQEITEIMDNIKEYGLGYDSKEDEDYLTNYGYCDFNGELSCKIFNLYDKIYASEDRAKAHFEGLLNTIDPDIDYVIDNKVDKDGNQTDEPTNIGADFNGYGVCFNVNSDLCERGIWDRIDEQDVDMKNIDKEIKKIIDNEIQEVDDAPFTAALAKVEDSMTAEMDEVEATNNELFDTKIDVYVENFERINTYLSEVVGDTSYIDAINEFESAENSRQNENHNILNNVYTLLPNTILDGLPNKLVYSFISSPLDIVGGENENVVLDKVEAVDTSLTKAIVVLSITMIIFIGIYIFINRGDNG